MTDSRLLQGRSALVTGAGSGIGAAAARAFAQAGGAVALVGRTARTLETVATQIREAGGEAIVVAADVAEEAAVDAAVAHAIEAFGKIDIAFANAGMLGSMTPLAGMEVAEFDAVVATNLRGVWLTDRAAIRAMTAADTKGAIITTSSFVARAATVGMSAYAASKAGVDALTRAAALEVGGRGIRVNAIAPGVIETEMFATSGVTDEAKAALEAQAALKRLGTPDDIARAAVWLASDQASFVTGQTILVDGGFTIPGMR